jgi:hypothetical protein
MSNWVEEIINLPAEIRILVSGIINLPAEIRNLVNEIGNLPAEMDILVGEIGVLVNEMMNLLSGRFSLGESKKTSRTAHRQQRDVFSMHSRPLIML